jgi:CBS domain containing-hemolysin-like protein
MLDRKVPLDKTAIKAVRRAFLFFFLFSLLISISLSLSLITIQLIDCGHSRIPVYEGNKQNIKGLLLVKNLIEYDTTKPIDLTTVRLRPLPTISSDIAVYDLLNQFKSGKSHMVSDVVVCRRHCSLLILVISHV